jgi:riboflavin kinase/FMN adenylyltransferase
MQHLRSLASVTINNSWITIGSFDGVHIGHQAIIRQLINGAQSAGLPSVVVTFHPHPAVVLGKVKQASYLTSPNERAALLGEFGVDYVVTLPFDQQLAELSALDFMRLLTDHLGVRHLCIGYDFALGRDREGNVERLKEIGAQLDFDVKVFDPVFNGEGNPVSSSLIRQRLAEGQLAKAVSLLGRHYRVEGKVVHGDGRGKQLGFPTANLEIWPERLLPPSGVYATKVWIDENCYPAIANLGFRPTFVNQQTFPILEVHVMEWKRDLYGQTIQIDFIDRIRDEMRFSSVEALITQIKMDIQISKEVIENAPCP